MFVYHRVQLLLISTSTGSNNSLVSSSTTRITHTPSSIPTTYSLLSTLSRFCVRFFSQCAHRRQLAPSLIPHSISPLILCAYLVPQHQQLSEFASTRVIRNIRHLSVVELRARERCRIMRGISARYLLECHFSTPIFIDRRISLNAIHCHFTSSSSFITYSIIMSNFALTSSSNTRFWRVLSPVASQHGKGSYLTGYVTYLRSEWRSGIVIALRYT